MKNMEDSTALLALKVLNSVNFSSVSELWKSQRKHKWKKKNSLKITFKMFYHRICENPPMKTHLSSKSYSRRKKQIKLL